MKIILVCGDRNWENEDLLEEKLLKRKPDCIVEGGQGKVVPEYVGYPRGNHIIIGADHLAGKIADRHGIPHFRCDANWNYYKKAAGPIRNSWMLKFMKISEVLAFHNDIKSSKGTADTIRKAKKLGIKTTIITEKRK